MSIESQKIERKDSTSFESVLIEDRLVDNYNCFWCCFWCCLTEDNCKVDCDCSNC